VPIDRDAVIKEAEHLLRQEKLDGAIEAYVRLIEERPSDWNSINALGDPCLRAGDVEQAIAQFTRAADQFVSDGALQKATALYKKALRAQGDHEPALQQLGEIAVRPGLQADAEVYLQRLSDQRWNRGDRLGAAESLARLETLKEAKADSQTAATSAAQEVGDTREAVALFGAVADEIEQGRIGGRNGEVPPEIAVPPEIDVLREIDALFEIEVQPEIEVLREIDALFEIEVQPEIEVLLETEVSTEIDAPLEVDLSNALADMAAAPAGVVAAPPVDPHQPGLEEAQTAGRVEDVAALESAVHDARTRFAAAAELGRLYVRRGDLRAGIEWLERAVEVPPVNQEEGFAALYDLADALERLGETARALAVLIELDLDSGGYRDGRARVDRLVRAQAGSPGQ